MTTAEQHAIDVATTPSPYADAVAYMFISGVSADTVAQFFRIGLDEVAAYVRWVCTVNGARYK